MSSPDIRARSPWAALQGIKSVTLSPPMRPVSATLTVPGSKSLTNRALILAGAASGKSRLSGILRSDDSYWCCESLRQLGVRVDVEAESAEIEGCDGKWPTSEGSVYVGAAGTIARFLPGVLAASHHGSWLIEGSTRMSERPIGELVDALSNLGAQISYPAKKGCYPLQVKGAGLRGGTTRVSGKISSQFLSGILLASPLAENPVTVQVLDGIVQHSYVDLTVALMRQFGAEIEHNSDLSRFEIQPTRYRAATLELEADASTSCYFLSLAALTNGEVTISNLASTTSQPDLQLVDFFEKMGVKVARSKTSITVKGMGTLKGGFEANLRELSDQALTLAAVSVFADAPIRISGVAHIRHHESDRVHCMYEALSALGIKVDEHEDGLTIHPGSPRPATVSSYDDHRMAMSLALIGSRAEGVTILDPGTVSKTCPGYFDKLKDLGFGVSLA